jgi:DNA-binding SARP family transcriptional activator
MRSDQAFVLQRGPRPLLDTDGHPVSLCLLGNFRLFRQGRPVSVRSGGKTEALLASLGTATRSGVPREALLRQLWPESEQALASNALNNLVHALRRLLGDALGGASPIVLAGGYYRLNHEAGVFVDVVQFKALAAQSAMLARAGKVAAAAELAQKALQLYTGDLSVNMGGNAHAIFERDTLRATCLGLLVLLADEAFQRGDFASCQSYALQLLALDACREDAHRLLMRCHVRLGQRAQALRHFQTVQAVLRAEYEAGPEPATTALYEQIRVDPSAV